MNWKHISATMVITAAISSAIYYWFIYCAPTTVILVRHGDRTGENLNDLGIARAQELRRVLADANVDAIYASEVPRTQQTAQPLATQLGQTLQLYNTSDIADLANRVSTQHRGKVVLVVGHSNTVPQTLHALGISPQAANIPDTVFDHFYVLTIGRRILPRVMKLEYGANH